MIKLTTKILPNETFYSWVSRLAIRVGDGFGSPFIKQVYKMGVFLHDVKYVEKRERKIL